MTQTVQPDFALSSAMASFAADEDEVIMGQDQSDPLIAGAHVSVSNSVGQPIMI